MMQAIEQKMLRRLSGAADEADLQALARQLSEDPELEARFKALEAAWLALDHLEPSTNEPLGPEFTARVMAVARRQAEGDLAWSLAPTWARATAALALFAGLALGNQAAQLQDPTPPTLEWLQEDLTDVSLFAPPPSLAESWWGPFDLVDEEEATP